jgi:arsenite-transporting ATPase
MGLRREVINLVGLNALHELLVDTVPNTEIEVDVPIELDEPGLSELVDGIAADGHGLVMLMGKGGVGKTSLAAAIAVELAHRGLPVHLTTYDPAAHLTETLSGALDNLTVSRIDPHDETERYRQHVLASKGAQLDAQGRALLEEDLRSPCTEEIAVFQAFSRIIREAGKKFVVMDTAPTGHTLLLLDATGAYHREVTRQMGDKGMHFTTPMMQLQDIRQTKVLLVTWRKPRRYWKRQTCKPTCAAPVLNLGHGSSIPVWQRLRQHRRCCGNEPPTSCAKSMPSPAAWPRMP